MTRSDRAVALPLPSAAKLWASLHRAGDTWYLAAAVVVNLANFVFFGLVGHLVPPTSYGTVVALLNVVSISSIPLNGVQASVVQETVAQSRSGHVPPLGFSLWAFCLSGSAATVALAAASPWAGRFFGLVSVTPVLVLSAWLAPSVLSSLLDGVLIGTLHWRPIAVSLVAGAAVRVGATLASALLWPGEEGPLLATVFNAVVTLAIVAWALPRRPARLGRPLQLPMRTMATTVLVLGGYSTLVAIDTIMARHLFPGRAGPYAAAATLARIALFAPMAITTIGFPRFAGVGGRGHQARRLLVPSLTGVLVAGLGTALFLDIGRRTFIDVLFGARYQGAGGLVGLLGLEAAFLSAIGLLTYFHLARRSPVAALPGVTAVAATVIGLLVRPGPLGLGLLMATLSAGTALIMGMAALADPKPRPYASKSAVRSGSRVWRY